MEFKRSMAKTKKSKQQLEMEREIRSLSKIIESKGIKVRREKLSRGYNFKVRSGNCVLTGQDHIFLDKRLPPEQQMLLLFEVLSQKELKITNEDVAILSDKSRSLLDKNLLASTA